MFDLLDTDCPLMTLRYFVHRPILDQFQFNLLIGFNVYSEALILSLGSTPVAVGSPLEFQHHCGDSVEFARQLP